MISPALVDDRRPNYVDAFEGTTRILYNVEHKVEHETSKKIVTRENRHSYASKFGSFIDKEFIINESIKYKLSQLGFTADSIGIFATELLRMPYGSLKPKIDALLKPEAHHNAESLAESTSFFSGQQTESHFKCLTLFKKIKNKRPTDDIFYLQIPLYYKSLDSFQSESIGLQQMTKLFKNAQKKLQMFHDAEIFHCDLRQGNIAIKRHIIKKRSVKNANKVRYEAFLADFDLAIYQTSDIMTKFKKYFFQVNFFNMNTFDIFGLFKNDKYVGDKNGFSHDQRRRLKAFMMAPNLSDFTPAQREKLKRERRLFTQFDVLSSVEKNDLPPFEFEDMYSLEMCKTVLKRMDRYHLICAFYATSDFSALAFNEDTVKDYMFANDDAIRGTLIQESPVSASPVSVSPVSASPKLSERRSSRRATTTGRFNVEKYDRKIPYVEEIVTNLVFLQQLVSTGKAEDSTFLRFVDEFDQTLANFKADKAAGRFNFKELNDLESKIFLYRMSKEFPKR